MTVRIGIAGFASAAKFSNSLVATFIGILAIDYTGKFTERHPICLGGEKCNLSMGTMTVPLERRKQKHKNE